jgi:hypothetical protein
MRKAYRVFGAGAPPRLALALPPKETLKQTEAEPSQLIPNAWQMGSAVYRKNPSILCAIP